MAIILGIESSCDDTGAAILANDQILSNVVASQSVHESFGGVVPEVASRAHQVNILPVVAEALKRANLTLDQIDAIAVTKGPGLMGPLLVGHSFAKGICLSTGKKLLGVDHMMAHILAHFAEKPYPEFPFLCLTVSGGHTQLVHVSSPTEMKVIGTTIDDAAGEAFDKISKLLGLPYPGGPVMDKLAKEGNPSAFEFSKPQLQGFDFSFSGLKTNVLYFLQAQTKLNPAFIEENLNDLCASVQHTIVEILMNKLKKAIKETNAKHVALAGGVSANSLLRQRFEEVCTSLKATPHIPAFQFCTDNAAMVAVAGNFLFQKEIFEDLNSIPDPRLKFDGTIKPKGRQKV